MMGLIRTSPFNKIKRLTQCRELSTTFMLRRRKYFPVQRKIDIEKYAIYLKKSPNLWHYEYTHEVDKSSFYKNENVGDDSSSASLPGFGPMIPSELPIVPVISSTDPIFPKFIRIIEIQDKKIIDLILKNIELKFPYAGIFTNKNQITDSNVIENIDQVYQTGTFIHIQEAMPIKDSLRLLVQGVRRISLDSTNIERNEKLNVNQNDNSILWGNVSNISENFQSNNNTKALCAEIIQSCRDLIQINQLYRESVHHILSQGVRVVDDASFLSDFCGALSSSDTTEKIKVLSETNVEKRLTISLELIKKELQMSKMQRDIGQKVEDKIKKAHHEHMLREQLKVIKKELGMEKDDKDSVLQKFRDAIAGKTIPENAAAVIDAEIKRLEFLEPQSSEFQVARNYLDWLTVLPWGIQTEDTLDVAKATEILDKDHYGMRDVKDRIIEFIAVSKLRGSIQGKIICFYGPPGTGKTSIAKSIARALNRKYYRFSVGGMSDVAEIKGHRRTYVGSMPGKIIQCLKKTDSENPLILIDEIDKLGKGFQGDPSSALLELLDPEQNVGFLDHYLDVPVDMSKALFICTANDVSRISAPLRDRMEMIEIGGYVTEEKVEIAQRYLIPKLHLETGILEGQISFNRDSLIYLIEKHCRESGVRNLQKKIQRIFRKSAVKIVQGESVDIKTDSLNDYVGRAIWTRDRMYDVTPPGTVCGLAWTSMGGAALYVESSVIKSEKGKGAMKVTGNIKDVMKESSDISYTVARNLLRGTKHESFFDDNIIHLHFPEGATPKDGPSAGVTITTALLSLATDTKLPNVAMTGEISLNQMVHAVGGIKEKILAAKRAEISKVFLPHDCQNAWDELDTQVKENIEIIFVKTYNNIQDQLFSSELFAKTSV